MAKLRLVVVLLLLVTLFAISIPVQAHHRPGHGGGPPALRQAAAGAIIGGLIDVLIQNVNVEDNLNNVLRNTTVQIGLVNLDDSLNRNEINLLSHILNSSEVLSRNRDIVHVALRNVANRNEVLNNFLNQNNIAINDVVAVDVNVLSGQVTVFTLGQ